MSLRVRSSRGRLSRHSRDYLLYYSFSRFFFPLSLILSFFLSPLVFLLLWQWFQLKKKKKPRPCTVGYSARVNGRARSRSRAPTCAYIRDCCYIYYIIYTARGGPVTRETRDGQKTACTKARLPHMNVH